MFCRCQIGKALTVGSRMQSKSYLCPRFNYVLWVQDLLDTTSATYSDKYDEGREVIGLDM